MCFRAADDQAPSKAAFPAQTDGGHRAHGGAALLPESLPAPYPVSIQGLKCLPKNTWSLTTTFALLVSKTNAAGVLYRLERSVGELGVITGGLGSRNMPHDHQHVDVEYEVTQTLEPFATFRHPSAFHGHVLYGHSMPIWYVPTCLEEVMYSFN